VRTGTLIPPGLNAFPNKYLNFPDDAQLMSYWSKID
jgi:hypothetical protein